MGIIIDYTKLTELANLLGIKDGVSIEEYLSNLDNEKFLSINEKLIGEVGAEKTIDYLNIILELTNFSTNKELEDELLNEESFKDMALNNESKDNILLNRLSDRIKKESFDKDGLYTDEEEYNAFLKYKDLKENFERYIRLNHKDFAKYIDNTLLKMQDDYKTEVQDTFIIIALRKLYSYTCDEKEVVEIKKDKKVEDMVEELREVRDDIANHNYRLVTSVAKFYLDLGLPKDDLEQEGKMGLLRAIEKFDVTKGNKFSTYATWWLKQMMKRGLANEGSTIRIPVHQNEKLLRINRALKYLVTQDGIEDPTDKEILDKLIELGYDDFTIDQINETRKTETIKKLISTDKSVGEEEDSTLIDFISSDEYEKPEELAEKKNLEERTNLILERIATAKKTKGGGSRKGPAVFKQLTFKTVSGENINIILTLKEYNDLMNNMKGDTKKDEFIQFLNKYKINPEILSSSLKISNIKLETGEKDILIFMYRTGLNNEFSDEFLARRNYNGVLFEENSYDDTLTLDKVGKLFGVTRERIRQIEAKTRKKIELEIGKRPKRPPVTIQLFMGQSRNIYDLLGISNTSNEYIIFVRQESISNSILVDSKGNIITLSLGSAQITVKNINTNKKRELHVVVTEPLKVSINNFINRKKELKLELNSDNKKDNQ